MNIALIDTFLDLSHRRWAEGLAKYSAHTIDLIFDTPHHWKWRMTGGSLQMAWDLNLRKKHYDLILATDMVHLPVFKSVLDERYKDLPVLLYFHENQITYPSNQKVESRRRRDLHYGFINYVSALTSDRIAFNSNFHKTEFLNALPSFLSRFPPIKYSGSLAEIGAKSSVLPVGMEPVPAPGPPSEVPVFIWNHRWEYDKNPEPFFSALYRLKEDGVPFELIVTGKSYPRQIPVFEEAKIKLSDRIIHFGFAEPQVYLKLLSRANIALITSIQEFFGIGFIEALQNGCLPIIPRRLVYAEHIPGDALYQVVYDCDEEIPDLLRKCIEEQTYKKTEPFRKYVERYLWTSVIGDYDRLFESMA